MSHPESDTAEQIFLATELLMAEEGLHNLSMHKIAKKAKISPGTIYLYFKSKDELLEKLARRIFDIFSQELVKNYNAQHSYFERYRVMWWNVWHYFLNSPVTLKNMNQYWSLPAFTKVCQEQESKSPWTLFCQQAIADQEICELPNNVLFSLSLESAINLVSSQDCFEQELSTELLENVIERTWRAIQK